MGKSKNFAFGQCLFILWIENFRIFVCCAIAHLTKRKNKTNSKKMQILATKNFFLKDFEEIYSTKIEGKNSGFQNFLNNLKIKNSGENWDEDHSQVDWNVMENHYQFFFDYEDNEVEISDWLMKSELSKYEFVYTWLNFEESIIMIKTSEFIKNWENVYMASIEGMILTTFDGKLVLEFTDDYKFNLNSNFEIKPKSKK